MMAEGKLNAAQLRGWVANRFYYQISIPVKDAAILSNCDDREIRREWILRILDHDGFDLNGISDPGGIEAWIQLGHAVGLSRDDVTSLRFVAPASRFAVDAYVNFARQRPWQEAVASSLTELFAPHIHQQRIDTWPEQYPWVDATGLQYFKNRLTQARRDVAHGLKFTLDYFSQTRALQERALEILQFKFECAVGLGRCHHAGPVPGRDHRTQNTMSDDLARLQHHATRRTHVPPAMGRGAAILGAALPGRHGQTQRQRG
jgi:pyrroloquinoline-quinone synthase